ncbi:MspA family porin [Nocardia amikacinitolerans]|uniref:MspA protein n=1 Tax=Nocardia amikacinitolerans TaxID=756689 RepID=A0A285L7V4_9NOCA|nr:MspA family porin [Nocardia amikacinitolerans]MCP2275236.1 MspA protein [Nocardia amikacinitolerans]MCP2290936.1 MspA protein [Nocardia amikacinitolerans]MCP2296028.1 MspA protein [Nocardia amikacinitolerans]SNY81020.1 MspA protein [Nocardia amikacinitolerans]
MSENRTNGLRRGARVAGVGAAAAVAMGMLSTGAANADTFVPLPDGQKVGHGVTITRTGERALISPSLAANGAGRVVWVSGNATADVTVTPEGEVGPNNGPAGGPGSNNSSTHGASQLSTGYIVGCQVSIADDAISAGVSGGVNLDGFSMGGSIGLNLGPGEVKFVQIDYKDILKPGVYSVEYQDAEIEIQGCAGYAQARAYTVVEIIGDHYSKTTLYGAPFSIG